MSITEILIWLGLIFVADIAAMMLDRLIATYRNKAREAVMCDICHKPRKLKQTFDKSMWVCRKCNHLYIEEFKNRGNQ